MRLFTRQRIIAILYLLLIGMILAIGSAWLAAYYYVDTSTGVVTTASDGSWTVTVSSNVAAVSIDSHAQPPASWSPAQATGAPDSPRPGDQTTAWAAATNNGSPEWLMLDFNQAYQTQFIEIYENLCPGAVMRISSVDNNGTETEIWHGDEQVLSDKAIPYSRTPAHGDLIHKVKLYIGRKDILGWNEVDAVALIDDQGTPHWAVNATASSWYGQTSAITSSGNPASILPRWAKIESPRNNSPRINSNATVTSTVSIEARGWPMVCLYDVQTQPATVPVSMTYLGSPVTSSWIPTPTATIKKVRWPIRPIWTGLLVDTLVLAVIAYLAWIVMVIPRRFIREVRWVKNGCCVKCGYDLGYNLQAGCPECGWRR